MNRSETTSPTLFGVAETLIMPLYIRAMESQRPDALIQDERAVALLKRLNPDSLWIAKTKVDEEDKVAVVLRNREFDRDVRDFLARGPQAVVVHIGCGLDSRFERVDNGQVEWYDPDLPEVIELRRKLLGGEQARCEKGAHSMPCKTQAISRSGAGATPRRRHRRSCGPCFRR